MSFCLKLKKDLQENQFEINPCDPCVANEMVNSKQLAVTWHVDDLKASHVDLNVTDELTEWVKKTCSQLGEVKCTGGKRHTCLRMDLDCTTKGQVKIDMVDCVKCMTEEFPKPEQLN